MIKRHVIYEAPQERFFIDVRSNKLSDIMQHNFKEDTGIYVAESERHSWGVSGDKIKNFEAIAFS